jgi:hypothetical protein
MPALAQGRADSTAGHMRIEQHPQQRAGQSLSTVMTSA